MSEPHLNSGEEPDELFGAAQWLLHNGSNLDAVHVLHAGIARAIQLPNDLGAMPKYVSTADAQSSHDRLVAEWCSRQGRPAFAARSSWQRQVPRWAAKAAAAVILAGLTARYVWAISDPALWPRQHPEGNWISRFYSNASREGFPLVRYDIGVNADFGAGGPARLMKGDHFSVVWDTCLRVAKDTTLAIELESDDSSKLLLDGTPLVEIGPHAGEKSAVISLRQGVRHLRVEFVENEGNAMVRLNGVEPDGTDAYQLRRPIIRGVDAVCE